MFAATVEKSSLAQELTTVENDGSEDGVTVFKQQQKGPGADFVTSSVRVPNLVPPKSGKPQIDLSESPEQSKPLERQWTGAPYRCLNGPVSSPRVQRGWGEAISKYGLETENPINLEDLNLNERLVPASSEIDDGWFLQDGQPVARYEDISRECKESEGHVADRDESHPNEQPVLGSTVYDEGWFLTDGHPVVECAKTKEPQRPDAGPARSVEKGSADLACHSIRDVPYHRSSPSEGSKRNKLRAKPKKERAQKSGSVVAEVLQSPVATAPPEPGSSNFMNEEVLIVDNVDTARNVVQLLRGKYQFLTHACDTEVCVMIHYLSRSAPLTLGKFAAFHIFTR